MKRMILRLLVLLFLPQLLSARIIRIPYDYFKIQEGIDAAVNGDTVWVHLGTYFEGINFKGKDILVTSNYIFDHDPVTIENTIIDGDSLRGRDTASVVRFISGESQDAILTGLTIQNGGGTYIDGWYRHGGGILCVNSSPGIESNYIKDNNTRYDLWDSGKGGGIAVLGNSFAQIEENRIDNNTGGGYYYGYGGGIYFDGDSCILKDNEISTNCAYGYSFMSTWGYAYGGGIYAEGEKITVIGNQIARNSVVGGGEAVGGGAYISVSGDIILEHSVLDSNECRIDGYAPGEVAGAGAYLKARGVLSVAHNHILRNYKPQWSQPTTLQGAGIWVGSSPAKVEVTWNRFEKNHGEALLLRAKAPSDSFLVTRNIIFGDSLGIYCKNNSPKIENNTIYSTWGYAIKTWLDSNLGLQIRNNIVASTVDGPGIISEGAYPPELYYNDVWNNAGGNYQGLEPGEFDIHEDPLFVDPERGDFRLTEESPCIDAGDPDPQYNDPDGSRNDIGAFWLGYTPVSETPTELLPKESTLFQNYPNPFNATTRITYQLVNPLPSKVNLEVYNLQGQVVSRLVDDCQTAGIHEAIWDGRTKEGKNAFSGVYIYTLCVDGNSTSRKMLFLK
jgi:hypothetical protein